MYHIVIPVLVARQYLTMSKTWLQSIHPADIQTFSMFHNLGLHLFSFYTFINLFSVLLKNGVSSGQGFYFNTPYVRTILFWFYLSK